MLRVLVICVCITESRYSDSAMYSKKSLITLPPFRSLSPLPPPHLQRDGSVPLLRRLPNTLLSDVVVMSLSMPSVESGVTSSILLPPVKEVPYYNSVVKFSTLTNYFLSNYPVGLLPTSIQNSYYFENYLYWHE